MPSITCYRCDGKGHIPGFFHVAQGVCFLCKGSGQLPERSCKNVGFSKQFIQSFAQSVLFPADTKAERIVRISEEHPTAEWWVMRDGEMVYYCQPVCRGSMWWAVPLAQWPEFVKHWDRAYKKWPKSRGGAGLFESVTF